jgi:cytochrome c-type biogenesis protein CcmH
MRRFGVLLLLLLTLVAPAQAIAVDPPVRANLPEIEDEVMCPICGTLLGLSHAPAAERQRVFIRKLIDQGKTKEEIKDALVAEYGGQVLAMPENRGIDVWAYLVPLIGFGLGIIGVIWAIFTLRRRRSDRDEDRPEKAPSGDEARRLDDDMARFDL